MARPVLLSVLVVVVGVSVGVGFAVSASGRVRARWVPVRLAGSPVSENGPSVGRCGGGGCDGARTAAINNRGQVVGTVNWQAVLWENGKVRKLGALGGQRVSQANDINERGQVVGHSYVTIGKQGHSVMHAFLWQNGKMRDLGAGEAKAINERGQIVGSSYRSGAYHAWLWEKGKMRDLPGEEATDINNRGQILIRGYKDLYDLYENGRRLHLGSPVLLNNHGVVDPDTAWQTGPARRLCVDQGYTRCDARAVNDRGQIVGSVPNVRIEGKKPALFESGRVTILPMPPGWSSAYAVDINEHNQIVGIGDPFPGTDDFNNYGAWLWTKRS